MSRTIFALACLVASPALAQVADQASPSAPQNPSAIVVTVPNGGAGYVDPQGYNACRAVSVSLPGSAVANGSSKLAIPIKHKAPDYAQALSKMSGAIGQFAAGSSDTVCCRPGAGSTQTLCSGGDVKVSVNPPDCL